MDSDQPPPQRPRTEGGQPEVPPPPPENPPQNPPPPSGGGGLAGAFSRTGVPDASRPPGPQDQQNENFTKGVALATFRPKYIGELNPENVESLTQNRAFALQSGASKEFPLENSLSDSAIQMIGILLVQDDKAKPIWQQIGEPIRILEPRLKPADRETIIKLFAFEKEILAILRSHYITAAHTEKGQNALQETKQLMKTNFSHSPAQTDVNVDFISKLYNKKAEYMFTQDQERELISHYKEVSKRLPCDPKRKDMVKHDLFEKNDHSESPKTINEFANRVLGLAKTVGAW